MYNKTITEFGFCDIWNNQGLGKCNHPPASESVIRLWPQLITLATTLIPDITKTSSNSPFRG